MAEVERARQYVYTCVRGGEGRPNSSFKKKKSGTHFLINNLTCDNSNNPFIRSKPNDLIIP
jgi:hypothetical protein